MAPVDLVDMSNSKRPQSRQPPWQREDAGPSDFGPWLKRQRELRGVALRDIADDTKISLRYLEALEANRFDVLPAQVFVKGFLRQYSRFVGLDDDEVVNAFLAAVREEVPEPEAPETGEGSTRDRRLAGRGWMLLLIAASVAALMIFAALVAFSWRQSREDSRSSASTSRKAPAAEAQPVDVSAPVQGPVQGKDGLPSSRTQMGTPQQQTPSENAQTRPPAKPPDEGAEVGAGTTVNGSQPASAQGTAPIVVALEFSATCWVDAIVDGSRRVSELAQEGRSLRLKAERKIELTLGDGDAVHIEVNGHPFQLPSSRHKVRHLSIDLSTVSTLVSGNRLTHE